ncbi:hypothetical protein GCM10020000_09520 [Streptomyces olivoverticillatus]
MTDESFAKTSRRHRHHWRRDLAELAALFTAVAAADSVANTVAHGPDGPVLLVSSAAALLATAGFHIWWSRRRDHAPPPSAADAATPSPRTARPCDESTLWRMRTTVRDEPGSLAALCLSLAERGVDILALQTHPLADGTVDELLLRAPAALAPRRADRRRRAGRRQADLAGARRRPRPRGRPPPGC